MTNPFESKATEFVNQEARPIEQALRLMAQINIKYRQAIEESENLFYRALKKRNTNPQELKKSNDNQTKSEHTTTIQNDLEASKQKAFEAGNLLIKLYNDLQVLLKNDAKSVGLLAKLAVYADQAQKYISEDQATLITHILSKLGAKETDPNLLEELIASVGLERLGN